jgi:hypothetical protein
MGGFGLRVYALQFATMLLVCASALSFLALFSPVMTSRHSGGSMVPLALLPVCCGLAWLCARGAERLMPPPRGFCRCGYSRSGIAADAPCPECGLTG